MLTIKTILFYETYLALKKASRAWTVILSQSTLPAIMSLSNKSLEFSSGDVQSSCGGGWSINAANNYMMMLNECSVVRQIGESMEFPEHKNQSLTPNLNKLKIELGEMDMHCISMFFNFLVSSFFRKLS